MLLKCWGEFGTLMLALAKEHLNCHSKNLLRFATILTFVLWKCRFHLRRIVLRVLMICVSMGCCLRCRWSWRVRRVFSGSCAIRKWGGGWRGREMSISRFVWVRNLIWRRRSGRMSSFTRWYTFISQVGIWRIRRRTGGFFGRWWTKSIQNMVGILLWVIALSLRMILLVSHVRDYIPFLSRHFRTERGEWRFVRRRWRSESVSVCGTPMLWSPSGGMWATMPFSTVSLIRVCQGSIGFPPKNLMPILFRPLKSMIFSHRVPRLFSTPAFLERSVKNIRLILKRAVVFLRFLKQT